jgi:HEAT repeat protein
MSSNVNLEELKEQLLKSHWPKCDDLASEIALIGTPVAKNILIASLKGKRHHVRTAALRNLIRFNDLTLPSIIEPLLNDPAYETRMEAKKAIKYITGKDVLTGRGE